MSTAARMSDGDPHKVAEALSLLDKAVLEMIRAQQPLSRILESLCLKIEERSPGLLCSVLLVNADGTTMSEGASPSLPPAYRAALQGLSIGPRAGSCGTAAYRQQPVVVTDIATKFRNVSMGWQRIQRAIPVRYILLTHWSLHGTMGTPQTS